MLGNKVNVYITSRYRNMFYNMFLFPMLRKPAGTSHREGIGKAPEGIGKAPESGDGRRENWRW